MSVVRRNLLTRRGYTPYCGGSYAVCGLPRLAFDGEQFKCSCGYRTNYEPEFIAQYKAFNAEPQPNQPITQQKETNT